MVTKSSIFIKKRSCKLCEEYFEVIKYFNSQTEKEDDEKNYIFYHFSNEPNFGFFARETLL